MRSKPVFAFFAFIYVASVIYSIIDLYYFCTVDGAYDALMIILFVGGFLFVCTLLSIFSFILITRAFKNKKASVAAMAMSCIAACLWLVTGIINITGHFKETFFYFAPFLGTQCVIAWLAFKTNRFQEKA